LFAIFGLTAFVIAFAGLLLYYVCSSNKTRRRKEEDDEAETRLLDAYRSGQFSGMYAPAYGFGYGGHPGYAQAFSVPNQGVIFPVIPDHQNAGGL
jgi:hypothetical protein